MATVYCDNCGTSLLEETSKFCRACGKPTPLSEAATKRFDEPPMVKHPTSPVGGAYTTPAYMAPFEMPAAEQTNDLRQKKQKRNLIIMASMMAVMIVALAALFVFFRLGAESQGIPVPPPPPPPGFQGGPPPPPPPPGFPGPSTIDPSLIYPGSTQTMTVQGEDGTRVLKLHSDDSSTKVADWYKARLRVTKITEILGQIIMRAGDINVIIFGGDEGAEILITRGDGDK